jgi:hypothetical protein
LYADLNLISILTFQKIAAKRRSVKDEIPKNIDHDEFLLTSNIFNCEDSVFIEDNPVVC